MGLRYPYRVAREGGVRAQVCLCRAGRSRLLVCPRRSAQDGHEVWEENPFRFIGTGCTERLLWRVRHGLGGPLGPRRRVSVRAQALGPDHLQDVRAGSPQIPALVGVLDGWFIGWRYEMSMRSDTLICAQSVGALATGVRAVLPVSTAVSS
jgi:hypothetical protein